MRKSMLVFALTGSVLASPWKTQDHYEDEYEDIHTYDDTHTLTTYTTVTTCPVTSTHTEDGTYVNMELAS